MLTCLSAFAPSKRDHGRSTEHILFDFSSNIRLHYIFRSHPKESRAQSVVRRKCPLSRITRVRMQPQSGTPVGAMTRMTKIYNGNDVKFDLHASRPLSSSSSLALDHGGDARLAVGPCSAPWTWSMGALWQDAPPPQSCCDVQLRRQDTV